MKSKESRGLGFSLVLSVGTLVIILVSILVLSGNFSSLVTTILKSHATMSLPQVNQTFTDPFKVEGQPNPDKWTA